MNAKPTDTVSHHGKFKYRAIDAVGKSQTGVIDADSEREAMRLLRGRHLTPTQLTPTQSVSGSGSGRAPSAESVPSAALGTGAAATSRGVGTSGLTG